MIGRTIWETLGIEATRDRAQIRRAYAARLKTTGPEGDSDEFQALRTAYEWALAHADGGGGPPKPKTAHNSDAETRKPKPAKDADAGADPPPPPRLPQEQPDPGSPNTAALAAALASLEALLTSPRDTDNSAMLDALGEILSSPAFAHIGVFTRTEHRLAALVAANAPRSDILLDPLIEKFGWGVSMVGYAKGDAVAAVLTRRYDLWSFRQLKDRRHPSHVAWHVLTNPPNWRTVWKYRLIPGLTLRTHVLLTNIEQDHPTLASYLNPQAIARRDDYLHRPRLAAWAWWTIISLPIMAAVVGFSLRGTLVAGLSAYVLALAVCGGVVGFHLYAIVWPQRLWKEKWSSKASPWIALGWAPGVLVLLIAAALLPPIPLVTGAISVLAGGICIWVLVTGEPDRRDGPYPWVVRLVMTQSFLAIWWLFIGRDLPPPLPLQLVPPVVAGMIATSAGSMSLFGWYGGLSKRERVLFLKILLYAAAASGMLLWLSSGQSDLRPPAAIAVTAVVLAHRTPAMALTGRVARRLPTVMLGLGLLIYFSVADGDLGPLVPGGAWLLLGVFATIVGLAVAQGRNSQTTRRA